MFLLSNVKYLIEVERNKVKYGSLQVLTIFTHFQQKRKTKMRSSLSPKSRSTITITISFYVGKCSKGMLKTNFYRPLLGHIIHEQYTAYPVSIFGFQLFTFQMSYSYSSNRRRSNR